MKNYKLNKNTRNQFNIDIDYELSKTPELIVTTKNANTGNWSMSRLWRAWMAATADYMAASGCTMPLMLQEDGTNYGSRPFNSADAHELFTSRWLGTDKGGQRLSWSKSGRDDMRAATKSERFHAMQQHEQWCTDKGIILNKPVDSVYCKLEQESNV